MTVKTIKNDIQQILYNQNYFNELEISRMIENDSISYESRINTIVSLLKKNVVNLESLKLLEAYFPVVQPEQNKQPIEVKTE